LEKDSNIVTVPLGYADGFARRLFEAGAEVLIKGRRHPLAGVVTMDQLLVDVGDDEVVLGEDVVLLGRQGDEQITADEWAQRSETITWEILCGVGARVPRVLVD
jgi:alanine racemase